jgi:hypothetical protein
MGRVIGRFVAEMGGVVVLDTTTLNELGRKPVAAKRTDLELSPVLTATAELSGVTLLPLPAVGTKVTFTTPLGLGTTGLKVRLRS